MYSITCDIPTSHSLAAQAHKVPVISFTEAPSVLENVTFLQPCSIATQTVNTGSL